MPAALDLPTAGSAAILPSPAAHAVGAVLVIARRDVERQLRNPGVLLAQLMQVGFFVLVFAVGVGGMVGEVEGVPFGAFAFAGIVLLQAVTVSVSSGLTYAWDREFGVLREMLVAPVPRVCLPLGKALGSVALVTLQSAALLGCGPLLGVPLTVASYALAVACCAVTAAAFSLLGLYLAMAIRGVETLQAAIQLAMYPLLFLSGSVFAPGSAPGWLATITAANPMTYAVELLRAVTLAPLDGAHPPGNVAVDIVVLGALLLIGLAGVWRRAGTEQARR